MHGMTMIQSKTAKIGCAIFFVCAGCALGVAFWFFQTDREPRHAGRLLHEWIGEINEVENHAQRGFDSRVLWKNEYDDLTDGSIAVRRMLIGLRRTLRGQPRN